MQHPFYDWLLSNGLASEADVQSLQANQAQRPFSLFREVSFLLYAGILVLCSGLGTLIYTHIDSAGHIILLALILVGSLVCIWLCHRRYEPFTPSRLAPPSLVYPYVVLLGVSLFLLWEGYVEYRYQLFEGYYMIPSLLAALVCFTAAYRFDHEGVLSIALTTLAATIGLTVLPHKWFLGNVDYSEPLFFSGVCMGIFIIACGYGLARRGLKTHFENTWAAVGGFLLLVCGLGLQYASESHWMALLIVPACFGLFLYARLLKSIGLYIMLVLTAYLSASGLLFHITGGEFWIFSTYFGMASFAGIGYMLVKYKHFLRINE